MDFSLENPPDHQVPAENEGRGDAHRPVTAPVRRIRGVVTQFAAVLLAVLSYFGVRGLTEGSESTAVRNAGRVLHLEALLGVDVEASLQGFVLDHREIVTAANWVYIWGHWPVIAMTLVWLYRRHRGSYRLLRNAMFISGAVGLVIFMTFPVAPPRLMPAGFVDTVTELSNSYRVLQPPSLVNKFAAVPSLHVGWNLLVGILIFRSTRRRAARLFALAGPAFMAAAVVLTANHYVVDAIAGSLVALTGLAAATALQRVGMCRQRQNMPTSVVDGRGCLAAGVRWWRHLPSDANGEPGGASGHPTPTMGLRRNGVVEPAG